MKVAHVGPWPFIRATRTRGYHLCEATIAFKDEHYTNFYTQLGLRGHHIILDNGAAEGGTLGPIVLNTIAKRIRATEIILPDVIGDSKATIKEIGNSLAYIDPYKRMMVPQGRDYDEWMDCLYRLMDWTFVSIGIPHHCESFQGGRERILTYFDEENIGTTYNVHLLGVSRNVIPYTQFMYHKVFPWIRGIDTGKAMAYAQARRTIPYSPSDTILRNVPSLDWEREVPIDFFDLNMTILERWADARDD